MKALRLSLVRWVEPVHVGDAAEPLTRASGTVAMTSCDLGVLVEFARGATVRKTTLVPWGNVKQAEVMP